MNRNKRQFLALATLCTLAVPTLSGCASLNQTERGAIIGTAGGAAVGAVIGKQVGSTAKGAIIGAAVGGVAGAVIGRRMDRQAAELEREIPGATVQRVGEGIAVTFEEGLLFPFNSATLYPAGQEALREFAESLRANPETEVLIVGHTDAVGSDAYNQTLSQRRAESAAYILTRYGVSSDRIRTSGRGESEPIASNQSDAGRQQNRRVEVAIFASEEYREQVRRQNPGR